MKRIITELSLMGLTVIMLSIAATGCSSKDVAATPPAEVSPAVASSPEPTPPPAPVPARSAKRSKANLGAASTGAGR